MRERDPHDNGDDPSTPGETAGGAQDDASTTDGLKQRFGGSLGQRPLMVYLVLFAGAATLLLLLGIVWISATGGSGDERTICTDVTVADANASILAGQVKRINVLVDGDSPLDTLTGIVLELNDGTCRQTAQGADVRSDLYELLGVVEFYNNFGEERVRIHYQTQDIQQDLLVTSTPTPLPTLPPTETETPSPTSTAEPTLPVTDTPAAPSPTATLEPLLGSPVVPVAPSATASI